MGYGLDIRLVMRHTAPTVELKRRCDVWDVEGRTTAIANVRKITGGFEYNIGGRVAIDNTHFDGRW